MSGPLMDPSSAAGGSMEALIRRIAHQEAVAAVGMAAVVSSATSGAAAPVGATWQIEAKRTAEGFSMTVVKTKQG